MYACWLAISLEMRESESAATWLSPLKLPVAVSVVRHVTIEAFNVAVPDVAFALNFCASLRLFVLSWRTSFILLFMLARILYHILGHKHQTYILSHRLDL